LLKEEFKQRRIIVEMVQYNFYHYYPLHLLRTTLTTINPCTYSGTTLTTTITTTYTDAPQLPINPKSSRYGDGILFSDVSGDSGEVDMIVGLLNTSELIVLSLMIFPSRRSKRRSLRWGSLTQSMSSRMQSRPCLGMTRVVVLS